MALIETRFDSEVLDLSLGMNLILPEHPDAWSTPPAVLYLLHGLTDDHTIWCRRTSIERYAKDYNLVVVMPDAYKSFYRNMAHGSDYWTFCAQELPALIQRWFNVSKNPAHTFVAGLSMGGYGAMKLALDRPGQYAAAASLSGALNLAAHIEDEFYEHRLRTFEAVFGDIRTLPGSEHDLVAQLSKLEKPPKTDFYLCVGTEDYLYEDSVAFRDAALHAGLNLTYQESKGEHEWSFWDTTIQHVLEWLPIDRLPEIEP